MTYDPSIVAGFYEIETARKTKSSVLTEAVGGVSVATGSQSRAAVSERGSVAVVTNHRSSARANSSDCAAVATGEYSLAGAEYEDGSAVATGPCGIAVAKGSCCVALATGWRGSAVAAAPTSVAIAAGRGRAMATVGGAIVLWRRDGVGKVTHIRASRVGENGIKAGVWYRLDADGQFVELTEEEDLRWLRSK